MYIRTYMYICIAMACASNRSYFKADALLLDTNAKNAVHFR